MHVDHAVAHAWGEASGTSSLNGIVTIHLHCHRVSLAVRVPVTVFSCRHSGLSYKLVSRVASSVKTRQVHIQKSRRIRQREW